MGCSPLCHHYNVFRPDKPWHSEYGHSHRALINEDFAVTVAQAHLLEAMIFWRELSGKPWHSEYGHSHRALINEDFAVIRPGRRAFAKWWMG